MGELSWSCWLPMLSIRVCRESRGFHVPQGEGEEVLTGLEVRKNKHNVQKNRWHQGHQPLSACTAGKTSAVTSSESKRNQPLHSRDPGRSRGCGLVTWPPFVPLRVHGSLLPPYNQRLLGVEKGERKKYKRLDIHLKKIKLSKIGY